MKRLPLIAAAVLTFAGCGSGSPTFLSTSSNPASAPTESLATESSMIPTTIAELTPSSTAPVAAPPTSTAAAPTTTVSRNVRATVCLYSYDGQCYETLEILDDPGCPQIKEDELSPNPVRIAVMPCEYGFWVRVAETELARQRYNVTPDGYYSSAEVDAVKLAQYDRGVEADGEIGPATWNAVMDAYQCDAPLSIRISLLNDDDCYVDVNGDGMWAPGDLIPD
jgi:Putative peptidoglycan binding domain